MRGSWRPQLWQTTRYFTGRWSSSLGPLRTGGLALQPQLFKAVRPLHPVAVQLVHPLGVVLPPQPVVGAAPAGVEYLVGQYLAHRLLPGGEQLAGQLDVESAVFLDTATESGPGPAVDAHLRVDGGGDGDARLPGLGDDFGQQCVQCLLIHVSFSCPVFYDRRAPPKRCRRKRRFHPSFMGKSANICFT